MKSTPFFPAFLIVLFLLIHACQPPDGVERLKTKDLRGTVWQKDRVELYDSNQVLIEVIPAMEHEKEELLKFDEENRVFKKSIYPSNSNNSIIDCGEWELKKGKLTLLIGLVQILPDYCELVNSLQGISFREIPISIEEELLVIEGIGVDVNLHYLSNEEREQIRHGELVVRSYYKASSGDIIVSEEPDCCLSLKP